MKKNTNLPIRAHLLRGAFYLLLLLTVYVLPFALAQRTGSKRTLTFAERVAYQRAIEDVYWRHRIWPKDNPDPKPSLDAVMSKAQIESKVANYLQKSQALEDYWQRPITTEQLQAEMTRMAHHTKQPDVLRELFAALGDDSFVVAECLARPALAQRLVTELNNADRVKLTTIVWLKRPLPPSVARVETQALVTMAAVDANYTLPEISSPSAGCIDDTWTATGTSNAPSGRYLHTAVWTGSEMIVWGGDNTGGAGRNTGGRYNPSTDSWTATSTTNAPSPRFQHTAVWTGSEMIVWGGFGSNSFFNTGGRYNPSTDSWTATSITNAPDARYGHTAVWTDSQMIVWGGYGNTGYFNTGARYNPSNDSWTATSTTNAPTARIGQTAVWTDSEIIIWGGANDSGYLNSGARYNPSTDSWTPTSITNAPSARYRHTAVWTGNEMIVWGGGEDPTVVNTGGRYYPDTDSWTATTTTFAPVPRNFHTAVWTSSEMIIWGGLDPFFLLDTGGRYNPSTDSWTATTPNDAPTARWAHTAAWTGSEMIVWGGETVSTPTARPQLADQHPDTISNTGGRYCAQFGPTPTPTPVGFSVTTTTPACDSVVNGTGVIDYVINLSDAVDIFTVQTTDFTVNGIPSGHPPTFSNDNTTITFHYTTNPDVTGLNTMHIPGGAFLRASDGMPILDFMCTFCYAPTALVVTTTNPPVFGTFSPPAPNDYQYDVNFDQAIDPTSVTTSDLMITGNVGGSVTNVQVVNNNMTARFTLHFNFGGSVTLSIAAGAIAAQSPTCNTNQPFTGTYTIQGPTPTPTPTATATATATQTASPTPTATVPPTPTPSPAGCSVTSSSPPCGSIVVGTPPTDFTVNLSAPGGGFEGSAFMVNGTPANSVTVLSGTEIIFHFDTSPVVEGLNTMHIPAGAFPCGEPGGRVYEFICTFTYQASTPTPTPTVARHTPVPRLRPTPAPRP